MWMWVVFVFGACIQEKKTLPGVRFLRFICVNIFLLLRCLTCLGREDLAKTYPDAWMIHDDDMMMTVRHCPKERKMRRARPGNFGFDQKIHVHQVQSPLRWEPIASVIPNLRLQVNQPDSKKHVAFPKSRTPKPNHSGLTHMELFFFVLS